MAVFQVGLLVVCLVVIADGINGEEAGPLGRILLSRAKDDVPTVLNRHRRSPAAEDYADDGDDSPEGRHLHKIRRKLKPHKFGHGGGHLGGGYPGAFAGAGYGGYPGFGGGHLGHGCRKCGGGFGGGHGWHRPQYGGVGGPIASAFARPGSHSHAATWNLGPFQGSFGLAHAG